jgi:ribosomal protein S18 acetylase RimI-like enzyme
MPVEIVRIVVDNADLLSKVADDVFDYPIDRRRVLAYVAAEDAVMYAAVAAELVVGQARGFVHRHPDGPNEFYVDNVGVAADWQRRGIATRLMRKLIAEAQVRGCSEYWLGTETDNRTARAFYRSMGLIETRMTMFGNFGTRS